jgi:mannosyltransferase
MVAVVLWVFFLYQIFGPTRYPKGPGDLVTLKNMDRDPNLDRALPNPELGELSTDCLTVTEEPEDALHRKDEGYEPGDAGTGRISATLLSLVRNSEVDGMVQAMRDLERTWNSKFNYPWTFFNDEPFTEEFKTKTQAETKAKCRYGEDA